MTPEQHNIQNLLPHREPFVFVDEVQTHKNSEIVATKNFSPDMPFFEGHFPSDPIVPGVLIQEALAQTAGVLIALETERDTSKPAEIFYLASAEIKFVSVARPPVKLSLRAKIIKRFGTLAQFEVEAMQDAKTVAKGKLVLAKAEG